MMARFICDQLVRGWLVPADFSDPAKASLGFDEVLSRRISELEQDEPDAVEMLTALALGPNMGMSTDEWFSAVSQLSGRNYDQKDLTRLLPRIKAFVDTDPNSPEPTYRFYHEVI